MQSICRQKRRPQLWLVFNIIINIIVRYNIYIIINIIVIINITITIDIFVFFYISLSEDES